jgi:hypothetical protein
MGLRSGGLQAGGVRNLSEISDIPDSGVSRWEFEQDVTDSWGSNDGSITGDPLFVTDSAEGSYSLDFDGTDDLVTAPIQSFPTPFTWSIWVNFDAISTGTDQMFMSIFGAGGDDVYLYQEGDTDSLKFNDDSTGIIDSASISTGTWYHVVGVRGDSQNELYLDAASQGKLSASAKTYDTGKDLTFGNIDPGATNRYTDGQLDDPRYYDKALSSTEVSNLYNIGSIDG